MPCHEQAHLLLYANQMSVKGWDSFPGLLANFIIFHLLCSIMFCFNAALVPGILRAVFCACRKIWYLFKKVCHFLLW